MKTTKDNRARWRGEASKNQDMVEGVHDEIFLDLIDDVDEATLVLRISQEHVFALGQSLLAGGDVALLPEGGRELYQRVRAFLKSETETEEPKQ